MYHIALLALLSLFIVANTEHENSATIGPEKGWLVIQGGGQLTNEVKDRFVALAGGPNADIVLIPTAEADSQIDVERMRIAFTKGFGVHSVTVLHTRDRARANSAGFVEPLRHANGVWIDGGRQWRLVDAYLGTAVETQIKALLARGGVVGGGSAGATIQGSFLVRGAPGTRMNPDGDNRIMMAPGYTTGFGFLPDSAIDQHVDAREREGDLHPVISKHPTLLGIGIDQSAAIVVHGDSFFVVGGQVVIHDGRYHDGTPYYFLSSGQAFDLARRAAIKEDSPLVLVLTAASRSMTTAGIITKGTALLQSRRPDDQARQINYECATSLYSIGKTAYAARPEGPNRIQIQVRDLDTDKLREYPCTY
ncbi:MAG TPA: cyanophycinase [Candidatus Angelobacter sp.]|jgi:cyanophycinase